MLLLALAIGVLIVAVGLGFLFGADNPIPWILIGVILVIPFFYQRLSAKKVLQWNDSFSVGIEHIDAEHRKLIGLVNMFRTAYEHELGSEYEEKALDELVDYTRYHFAHEEELMEKYGYPDLAAHREMHKKMIEQVELFINDYRHHGSDALGDIVQYLQDWLANHINIQDKRYGSYITDQEGGSVPPA